MSEATQAGERLRRHSTATSQESDPYDFEFEADWNQYQTDIGATSDEYLRLTDPTPITPELLKREGFAQIPGARDGDIELGSLQVSASSKHWAGQWVVCAGSKFDHIWYPPRTLGELRQLANRLGIPLPPPSTE